MSDPSGQTATRYTGVTPYNPLFVEGVDVAIRQTMGDICVRLHVPTCEPEIQWTQDASQPPVRVILRLPSDALIAPFRSRTLYRFLFESLHTHQIGLTLVVIDEIGTTVSTELSTADIHAYARFLAAQPHPSGSVESDRALHMEKKPVD